ncbi:hypothetical protein C5Y96_20925 [Blastopirellula marina]|uniref:Signal peptidase n=1 Tax=Blastopirellula marina TaxID=124 RepID=A0A2S8F181_9BACT|nr:MULTISPECIES: hypothetical protein [Pirellulaceae]PQO25921.1 hypothetical protein C5Y96_20925 [Blastopirellula marina]RCS44279.1 hypothetical protein DTL36_20970 [Bremerella cremea]
MPKLRLILVLLTLLSLHVISSPVFAQAPGEEEAGKSWVLNYIVVVLSVVLGVIVVGYGTNRETEEERKRERQEAKEKEERLKKLEQGGH